MNIIKYRKIFYIFSGLVIAASIAAVSIWGIKFGIDFTGGSIMELQYVNDKDTTEELHSCLDSQGFLGDYSLRETGEKGYILRAKEISEEDRVKIVSAFEMTGKEVEVVRFNNIGPILGTELKYKAITAIVIALILIVLFIAMAFRHVSKPVSSWKYGMITVVAFLHDLIIPLGFFAALGYFVGIEVDTLFVIALLVILGYSINDTIVVFDRIRENLGKVKNEGQKISQFDTVVNKSLNETISRSINTSLTTLLALLALYIFGSETTGYFALALIVGVVAGTYSSIFLASPLLVTLKNLQEKKRLDKISNNQNEQI